MTDKKTKLETLIEDARAMLDDYVKPPNPVFMYTDLRRELGEEKSYAIEVLEDHLVEIVGKVDKVLEKAQVIAKLQVELMDMVPSFHSIEEIEYILKRNRRISKDVYNHLRSDFQSNREILRSLGTMQGNEKQLLESLKELSRCLSKIRSAERSDKNTQ